MITTLTQLFLTLIAIGGLLTFSLFRFDAAKLQASGLLTKILMWIPLAFGFALALTLGDGALLALGLAILLAAAVEFQSRIKQFPGDRRFLIAYLGFFLIGFAHLGLFRFITHQSLLITLPLIVGTVIADVGGYFAGQLIGRHKLPETINPQKSWEGVAGQFVGALIGVALVDQFITHQGSLWLFIPIGLGAALGDLLNSRAKRILGVKNWSNAIPGHGGVLDRFCSLAGSGLIVFYWLLSIVR